MSVVRADWLSFVPAPLVDSVRRSPLAAGERERFFAAVLFADLAGSTTVGEMLARRGSIGAESLGDVLNGYISAVVDEVHAFGGQVAKFTGDGLLALWPGHGDASEALRSTLACGLALQRVVARVSSEDTSRDGVAMAMRVAVGCGEVSLLLIPTEGDHLEPLFFGEAVRSTAAACARATAGVLTMTDAVRDRLGEFIDAGAGSPGASIDKQVAKAPAACEIPADLHPQLRRLVSPAAVPIADSEGPWLAQLRRISALFVRIDAAAEEPGSVLAAARCITRAVERYGGALARIGVEEKGVIFLAVFGLVARTHEDDPARCVEAALEIVDGLAAVSTDCGVGVATGRAFCGALGTRRAREFTTVGDVVNVAARLMQAARNDALCDPETQRLAMNRVEFESLPLLRVKGRRESFVPYRAHRRVRPTQARTRSMIGRAGELRVLTRMLDGVVDSATARVVLVQGEAGIGKSTLLHAFEEEARQRDVTLLTAAGDPYDRDVPLHVWTSLLRGLIEDDDAPHGPKWRNSGTPVIESVPESDRAWWRSRLDVLRYVLGGESGSLSREGEALAAESQQVVLRLLQLTARERPLLILLEDAHWFDSSSWLIAGLGAAQLDRTMLVVATRPLAGERHGGQRLLLQHPDLVRLDLGALSREDAELLVRRSLDVGTFREPLVELMLERTRGHPMFITELARSLGDVRGTSSSEATSHAPFTAGPGSGDLPPNVEAVIAARIDALPPEQQLVLKVGSVLGPSFSSAALRAVFPDDVGIADPADLLASLCESGLLQRKQDEDEFEFRHALARDAVYAHVLHAKRRSLHEAVARWLEGTASPTSAAAVARLAYHWTEAARFHPRLVGTALRWLERAGEMAAARHANRETVRFFEQAIAYHDAAAEPPGVALSQRLRWERLAGEASFGLGDLARASRHLRNALQLAPIRHAESRSMMVFDLFRAIGEQAWFRLRRSSQHPGGKVGPEVRARWVEAASAYNFLQIIAFVEMDPLTAVYAALRAANLAERAGPNRPLIYALGGVGLLAGTVSRKLALRYHDLALQTVERLGDRLAALGPWFARGYLHMRPGEWEDAEAAFAKASAIAEEFGDRRFREMCEMQLGCIRFSRGDYRRALERYEVAESSARRRGDEDAQALALVGQVTALTHLGQASEAMRRLTTVDDWLGPDFVAVRDRGIRINALGSRALLLWRLAETSAALAAAQRAADCIAASPPLAHYALAGYAATAEVAVLAARVGRGDPRLLRTALRGLRRFRLAFPYARSVERLWCGASLELRGRRRRAHRILLDGLQSAEAIGAVHVQGLLLRELARVVDEMEATRLCDRATAAFEAAGAMYDLIPDVEMPHGGRSGSSARLA